MGQTTEMSQRKKIPGCAYSLILFALYFLNCLENAGFRIVENKLTLYIAPISFSVWIVNFY